MTEIEAKRRKLRKKIASLHDRLAIHEDGNIRAALDMAYDELMRLDCLVDMGVAREADIPAI